MVTQFFFSFLNAYKPKTQLIKALNFLDSSGPYGRLLKNLKPEGSKELFLPKLDFKNGSTLHFPKRHQDFGDLETNQRHEIQT